MRILFNQIFLSFIILLVGTISFLKLQDDERIIFQRIIAQEDISSTINNNSSLLLQNNNQTELLSYIQIKNIIIVQLLANQLETKLNKSAAILELPSKLTQIRSPPKLSIIF